MKKSELLRQIRDLQADQAAMTERVRSLEDRIEELEEPVIPIIPCPTSGAPDIPMDTGTGLPDWLHVIYEQTPQRPYYGFPLITWQATC